MLPAAGSGDRWALVAGVIDDRLREPEPIVDGSSVTIATASAASKAAAPARRRSRSRFRAVTTSNDGVLLGLYASRRARATR